MRTPAQQQTFTREAHQMALTDDAHQLIEQHFLNTQKGVAVDATCGNGNDTLFLAKLGFDQVISFDLQKQAIESTKKRLVAEHIQNAGLILDSHEHMVRYIKQQVDCVMFNFGYLPNGDKTITTLAISSLKALEASCILLSKNGLITLMCYPGHPEGLSETKAIKGFLDSIRQHWIIETHLAVSPKPTAPMLFILKRKG